MHLVHFGIAALLLGILVYWTVTIERSMKADRAAVKARKEKGNHVCGGD